MAPSVNFARGVTVGVVSLTDAGVVSPADLAGVVTVGMASQTDAGVASPADLAGVVTIGVTSLADAVVVSLADAGVASSSDLAGVVTVGVASLVNAGVASLADLVARGMMNLAVPVRVRTEEMTLLPECAVRDHWARCLVQEMPEIRDDSGCQYVSCDPDWVDQTVPEGGHDYLGETLSSEPLCVFTDAMTFQGYMIMMM